jgi:branched-chain amino acid transport system permease protein
VATVTSDNTLTERRDQDSYVRDHFDRTTRRYLLSILSDSIIAEHRRYPAHPSEPLARLLAWCQRRPIEEQYAIKKESDGTFRIIFFSGLRGRGPTYAGEERFATFEEARHGAFLRHIKDLTGR